jgi:hypothetical protein
MSLIPSGAGDSGSISELPTLLKRWMGIQEEMSTLNNELKQRRTQSKALKDMILRIMESNRVAALNVSKGTVIHKIREAPEKISNDYLLKHCKDFFGGDEERARALVTYLEEHRGTSKVHDLKLQMPKNDDGLSQRS